MTVNELKFSRINPEIVKQPTRGTLGSAGIDFYVPLNLNLQSNTFEIPARGSLLIPSGIKVKIPDGYALIAMNKSGIATKKGLIIGACVIDSDYQGEIHIHLISQNDFPVQLNAGEKIVQFLLIPVEHCAIYEVPENELFDATTARGQGGFGSTGEQ